MGSKNSLIHLLLNFRANLKQKVKEPQLADQQIDNDFDESPEKERETLRTVAASRGVNGNDNSILRTRTYITTNHLFYYHKKTTHFN